MRTNILVFQLRPGGPAAAVVVERALAAGVRIFAFGPRTIRAVTHLDVSAAECERAGEILREVIDRAPAGA